MKNKTLIVPFGGGTNSTGMLVGLLEHDERWVMAGEGQATAARCGLGRSFVWGDFLQDPLASTQTDAGVPEVDCGCYD